MQVEVIKNLNYLNAETPYQLIQLIMVKISYQNRQLELA